MQKIVFLGGKQIGYDCLQFLNTLSDVKLELVISNTSDLSKSPDRWYPKIHTYCNQFNLPYQATDTPHSSDILSRVSNINPDFIIVVYYDNILKPKLFNLAKRGAINLHLADALKYRGCYPTTMAIMNGEQEYGVTLHYIDEGIDTGPIIARKTFPLSDDLRGDELYFLASRKGLDLFRDNIENVFQNKVLPVVQTADNDLKKYKRNDFPPHDLKIKEEVPQLYNRIRALLFSPFPPPYFFIGNQKYQIVKVDENSDP